MSTYSAYLTNEFWSRIEAILKEYQRHTELTEDYVTNVTINKTKYISVRSTPSSKNCELLKSMYNGLTKSCRSIRPKQRNNLGQTFANQLHFETTNLVSPLPKVHLESIGIINEESNLMILRPRRKANEGSIANTKSAARPRRGKKEATSKESHATTMLQTFINDDLSPRTKDSTIKVRTRTQVRKQQLTDSGIQIVPSGREEEQVGISLTPITELKTAPSQSGKRKRKGRQGKGKRGKKAGPSSPTITTISNSNLSVNEQQNTQIHDPASDQTAVGPQETTTIMDGTKEGMTCLLTAPPKDEDITVLQQLDVVGIIDKEPANDKIPLGISQGAGNGAPRTIQSIKPRATSTSLDKATTPLLHQNAQPDTPKNTSTHRLEVKLTPIGAAAPELNPSPKQEQVKSASPQPQHSLVQEEPSISVKPKPMIYNNSVLKHSLLDETNLHMRHVFIDSMMAKNIESLASSRIETKKTPEIVEELTTLDQKSIPANAQPEMAKARPAAKSKGDNTPKLHLAHTPGRIGLSHNRLAPKRPLISPAPLPFFKKTGATFSHNLNKYPSAQNLNNLAPTTFTGAPKMVGCNTPSSVKGVLRTTQDFDLKHETALMKKEKLLQEKALNAKIQRERKAERVKELRALSVVTNQAAVPPQVHLSTPQINKTPLRLKVNPEGMGKMMAAIQSPSPPPGYGIKGQCKKVVRPIQAPASTENKGPLCPLAQGISAGDFPDSQQLHGSNPMPELYKEAQNPSRISPTEPAPVISPAIIAPVMGGEQGSIEIKKKAFADMDSKKSLPSPYPVITLDRLVISPDIIASSYPTAWTSTFSSADAVKSQQFSEYIVDSLLFDDIPEIKPKVSKPSTIPTPSTNVAPSYPLIKPPEAISKEKYLKLNPSIPLSKLLDPIPMSPVYDSPSYPKIRPQKKHVEGVPIEIQVLNDVVVPLKKMVSAPSSKPQTKPHVSLYQGGNNSDASLKPKSIYNLSLYSTNSLLNSTSSVVASNHKKGASIYKGEIGGNVSKLHESLSIRGRGTVDYKPMAGLAALKPAPGPTLGLNTSQTYTEKRTPYRSKTVRTSVFRRRSSNYNIDDFTSDHSSDDELHPKKAKPKWAYGPSLKEAVMMMEFGARVNEGGDMVNESALFAGASTTPHNSSIFARKGNKSSSRHPASEVRGSSVLWDTPPSLLRPHHHPSKKNKH